MDDVERFPVDSETLWRGLQAKKRAASRKISAGRNIQKHGIDLEREGTAELADAEAFERVLRSLPTNDQEMAALENAVPEQWLNASAELRNVRAHEAAHSDLRPRNMVFQHAPLSRTQRDQVLQHCAQMLSSGAWRTTEELLEGLVSRGVQLTSSNPLQRVSQILSMSDSFQNQRGRGWSLKTLDASPGSNSLPSERADDDQVEDPIRTQARRVVNRGDNSAR